MKAFIKTKVFGDLSNTVFTAVITIITIASIGAYFILSSNASSLSADFNDDNTVSILDLSILATNWGKSNVTDNMGDTNGDGLVNVMDLSALASQWGQTVSGGSQPANSINARDYGALGNGTTDDSAAILRAITAASGRVVYFPAGTYRLANSLTIPDNAKLTGDSMATSWLQGQIIFGSDSTFTDLKIGSASASDAKTSVRNVDGATGSNFIRCHFRGGGGTGSDAQTMALGGGRDLYNTTFTYCEWERSLGTSYNGNTGAAENTLSITANGNVVSGVTFENCHLGVSNGVATGAQRMMVEVWTAHGTSNWWRNITFRGCEFETSNYHQLDFACYGDSGQGSGVLIENCTFHGGGRAPLLADRRWGYAICLEWPADVTIRNNHFHRSDEAAVFSANFGQSYDTHWIITGNVFDWDTAEDNIVARRSIIALTSSNNTITGNTFIFHGDFYAWPGNGIVEFGGANATGNDLTNNTFQVSQTQRITNQWNGASGNTISPNNVIRL